MFPPRFSTSATGCGNRKVWLALRSGLLDEEEEHNGTGRHKLDRTVNMKGPKIIVSSETTGSRLLERNGPRATAVASLMREEDSDETLYKPAHRLAASSDGRTANDELSCRNSCRRDTPRKFFTLGKVSMVLWVEPTGGSSNPKFSTMLDAGISTGRFTTIGGFGDTTYSKVRRFIVVRDAKNFCTAVPITTYSGQGVAKPGVKEADHAIMYTSKTQPQSFSCNCHDRKNFKFLPDKERHMVSKQNGEHYTPRWGRTDWAKLLIRRPTRLFDHLLLKNVNDIERMAKGMFSWVITSKAFLRLGTLAALFTPVASAQTIDAAGVHTKYNHGWTVDINPPTWFIIFENASEITFVSVLAASLCELALAYNMRPLDKHKNLAVGMCLTGILLLCGFAITNLRQLVVLEWFGLNLTLLLSAVFHAWLGDTDMDDEDDNDHHWSSSEMKM